MPTFDETATDAQVVAAFGDKVKGRNFVITGTGMPSLGGQAAIAMASGKPAHIIIASRTPSKAEPVFAATAAADSSIKITSLKCELTDRDSVRAAAAAEILEAAPSIDVLINNAGVMAVLDYEQDRHGVESQLSDNYLGHFLLTNLLVPGLLAAKVGARVVNMTSQGYRVTPFRFDDWNFSDGMTYDEWTGYGQACTARMLFAHALTKRLRSRGVTSTSVHPGVIMGTNLGAHLEPEVYSRVYQQGTATMLVAALDPEVASRSPAYLANSKIEKSYDFASDAKSAEKLWKLSEDILGERFEY
ncbi:Uu.00g146210.m01.CDS01 [Anthostomella pinea]|uniref:Uu.00g146210.m01.CDS01 n=1 Tax=Anthostomella pinea TaxID=933095 RepID=A0AAI8VKP5_9PEZI|nr:Uu.00g146210.m01.CDS01 [Anthostomella pinea]